MYAKCLAHGRRDLWKQCEGLLQHDCPVLLAGDFNCITMSEEKVGVQTSRRTRVSGNSVGLSQITTFMILDFPGPWSLGVTTRIHPEES